MRRALLFFGFGAECRGGATPKTKSCFLQNAHHNQCLACPKATDLSVFFTLRLSPQEISDRKELP